jgi:hypothetical protein
MKSLKKVSSFKNMKKNNHKPRKKAHKIFKRAVKRK